MTFSRYKRIVGVGIGLAALCALNLTVKNLEAQEYLRHLSLYLGDGQCSWTPPDYDIPADKNFKKLLIAGYPSGDKRLVFLQMEALTGLPTKDEWDFENLGITNEPFIKANYPHHEGIWGWETVADEVVLVVRNIRRSMVEYHDILWDIGYAKTWDVATENLENLYAERPPMEDFLIWRDLRVIDEIDWYGWFIDYYMEDGLMRDMYTKKITTKEHWDLLMRPEATSRDQMTYEQIVGDAEVTPTRDPHCVNDISEGCSPIEVVSAEKLILEETGPAETRKIANLLVDREGMENLIPDDSWECIWTELIVNKKGLKTFLDREGGTERGYFFSEEILESMIAELDRLIDKYSGDAWNTKQTAQTLVGLLEEHKGLIVEELEELQSGERMLTDRDFLGPRTRANRKKEMEEKGLYW